MVRNLKLFAAVITGAAVACSVPTVAFARGGGHGGGGHGGGHGGYHGGGHAYHPSAAHYAHHNEHHDGNRDRHYDHHHHDWHHGGWVPYAGAFGLGYGLGWWGGGYGGWGYGGGDYVDNSDNSQTIDNSTTSTDSSGDVAANVQSQGPQQGLPVDTWPELGVSTYSGQYGAQNGLVIVRVVPQSAADRAGFVAGDVILTFNGQPVPDADTLDTLLSSAKGQFEATVWDARTGRKSTLTGALDPNAPPAQK